MSTHYENTATRLRPKTFSEVTGQKFIVSTVCHSIEQGSIAPAYLFSGPRGVGKTSAARLVALAINRPDGTDIDQLSYPGSDNIRLGKSLDVVEIDGASYTSVDNVRNIREEILYAPVHFKYKVYIIDEVHMLSHSAFNALLKTIEEPPPYIVFIFATTELHKVPATIRSRCQQYSFRLISMPEIFEKLQSICTTEHIKAEVSALQWIAKEAQGSLRDAYTIFDQIKAFSNNDITFEKIKANLGLAGLDTLNELFELCLKRQRNLVLEKINALFLHGVSVEQFVIESAEYVRNLMLLKSEIHSEATLGYMASLFNKDIYGGFSIEQLERALALLLECYKAIRYSSNPRFEIELVYSQLCDIWLYKTPQQLVIDLHSLSQGSMGSRHADNSLPVQGAANASSQSTVVPNTVMSTKTSVESVAVISAKESIESTVPTNLQPINAEHFGHAPPAQKKTELDDNSLHSINLDDLQHTLEKPALTDSVHKQHSWLPLWAEVVSTIREKNESFALVLDAVHITNTTEGLTITFRNQYAFDRYMKVADRVLALAKKIATDKYAHSDIHIKAVCQVAKTAVASKTMQPTVAQGDESDTHTISKDTENVLTIFGGKVINESH